VSAARLQAGDRVLDGLRVQPLQLLDRGLHTISGERNSAESPIDKPCKQRLKPPLAQLHHNRNNGSDNSILARLQTAAALASTNSIIRNSRVLVAQNRKPQVQRHQRKLEQLRQQRLKFILLQIRRGGCCQTRQ
jgi:hypothetical protein